MESTQADAPRMLDELDLAIVHALQIDARAPWTRVAEAVGADAATVARHWQRMSAERLAWTTAWPSPRRWSSRTDVAAVLLERGTSSDVLAAVVALPWVIVADETSAGILVLVATGDGLPGIAGRVAALVQAGASVLRVEVASAVVAEDSSWRLRSLSAAQQAVLRGRTGETQGTHGADPRPPRREVLDELAAVLDEDPRMPAAALAARLGVSEATARRTVERATASGHLRLGCDLAMPAAGLGRGVILWASAAELERAAERAARLPEAHRVGAFVGAAPLFLCVRGSSLTIVPAVERAWGSDVEVHERWTVLRSVKRNGHLLDDAGRTAGRIAPVW